MSVRKETAAAWDVLPQPVLDRYENWPADAAAAMRKPFLILNTVIRNLAP